MISAPRRGASHETACRSPLAGASWESVPVLLPLREDLDRQGLEAQIRNAGLSDADRRTAALRLGFLQRASTPTRVSRLSLAPGVSLLCLPGEPFIEYQLFAASLDDFVVVAGYGDTGPGYVPLARSFAEGGYEITASGVSAGAEKALKRTLASLLREARP